MTVFRHLLLSLLVLCAAPVAAQSLTESAQISLLTCAPGADLYSAFGHSAIRVYDPELGIDKVYNYGTFDFDPPGFYVEFVRGKLNYRLNTERYQMFDRVYRYLERSYQAQELDLTLTQKRQVYEFLETNALPENAYYLYDFFFDNCATRIRDVFVSVLGDSLRFANPQRVSDSTFRNLLDQYVEARAWSDFGIDLALGALIDKKTTPWEQMFHPDYLAIEVGKAEILRNGQWQPLVRETVPVFTTPPTYGPTPLYAQPRFLFGLILLVVAFFTWRNWTKKPLRFVGDGILFLIAGLGGIILFLLWLPIGTCSGWFLSISFRPYCYSESSARAGYGGISGGVLL
jgi:hypothetical protein